MAGVGVFGHPPGKCAAKTDDQADANPARVSSVTGGRRNCRSKILDRVKKSLKLQSARAGTDGNSSAAAIAIACALAATRRPVAIGRRFNCRRRGIKL